MYFPEGNSRSNKWKTLVQFQNHEICKSLSKNFLQHVKMSDPKERIIKLVIEKLEKLDRINKREIEINEKELAREVELEKL